LILAKEIKILQLVLRKMKTNFSVLVSVMWFICKYSGDFVRKCEAVNQIRKCHILVGFIKNCLKELGPRSKLFSMELTFEILLFKLGFITRLQIRVIRLWFCVSWNETLLSTPLWMIRSLSFAVPTLQRLCVIVYIYIYIYIWVRRKDDRTWWLGMVLEGCSKR
jgi:hypothetical protein